MVLTNILRINKGKEVPKEPTEYKELNLIGLQLGQSSSDSSYYFVYYFSNKRTGMIKIFVMKAEKLDEVKQK